ncbi:MAG: hypothetical protein VST68_06400, partial [Nitrospirota bacterium]|nr:hypothetical protein [Nitrospirota bacterium]
VVDAGVQTISNDDFTDQSLLLSTINVTARSRQLHTDTQLVLRGSDSENFLGSSSEQSSQRLRRAYLKHENNDWGYLLQIGRQPGHKGGVLGAFDGGWVAYQGLNWLGFNLIGGLPAQVTGNSDLNFSTDQYFVGGNVDITPDNQDWSGNLYMINQMVSGIVDRQAVGAEARFFSNGLSLFSLVDFDVSYRLLNIAMLNGSWQSSGGTTLNVLVDHRTTPTTQTANALLATGDASVEDALQTNSESTLRDHAKALTAESDLVLIGVTHPISSTWQLGGDARFIRTTGTGAAGIQPALAGSGDILTYTLQATGNEVFFRNHTLGLTASYIDNPSYQAQSFVLNSLARFWENWQLDSFVNFYIQESNLGTNIVRVTPSARLSYRWKDNMTFEIQGGVERLTTNGTTQEEEVLRDFFSFGYIWEH